MGNGTGLDRNGWRQRSTLFVICPVLIQNYNTVYIDSFMVVFSPYRKIPG
jgi:hypothetical protein